MAGFYKPHRNPNWNYGGAQFKLSRSKIDLFKECPRCFYIDNRLGTARPPGYPFNLNSAVDELLKREFDLHRRAGTPHPLMVEAGIDAVPFQHEDMDKWRDALRHGVMVDHQATGFVVRGAVDDIWVTPGGMLLVVDYKATSKDGEVNLDADWQDGYKRQMEVYQWLLRQNGFEVSDTGYFVYANGRRNEKQFDAKIRFDIKVIPYVGSDEWVEPTLLQIKQVLDDERVPSASPDCDYCTYRKAVRDVTVAAVGKKQSIEVTPKPKKEVSKEKDRVDIPNETLF